MRKIKAYLKLCLLICLPMLALSQTRQVTGKVTSASGEPIPLATVLVKGSTQGTSADENGNYSISVSGSNAVLVFSAAGFESKEIAVGNANVVNAQLTPSADLDEVVVTAFGIKRAKRSLGYSTQEVTNEDIMLGQQSNVVNALQGKIAGVQINAGGGAPGQGASILIRGIKSLDPGKSNQPLFVIDGVIMDNSTNIAGNVAELRGMSNRAADINPDDIESISVLKGGAATALYGQAGSNGVVLITTKSAKAGSMQIGLTTSYGLDEVNKLPEVQTKYSQGWYYEYNPDDFWPSFGPTVEEAKAIDPTHPDKLYHHYGQGFQTGNQFRTTLSMNGGTERARLSSSVSYFNQEGMIPFSDYRNISFRINGQLQLSEKLSFRPSLYYSNSGGARVNANRYNESLTYWSPRHNVMDFKKEDGTMKSYGTTNNPVYGTYGAPFRDDVHRMIGDISFTYKPFSFLDIDYKLGVDQYNDLRRHHAEGPRGTVGEMRHGDMGLGFVREYRLYNRLINSNLMATATKDWLDGKLSTSLRVGNEVRESKYDRVNAEGSELDIPTLLTINNAKVRTTSQQKSLYRIVSLYGEFTAGWDNKLFLTLTGRRDHTSVFTQGLNDFFYPSYTLSAIVSDMVTLPTWWTYAKVRGSYAEIGKDTDPYRNNTYYGSYVLTSTSQVLWTRSASSGDRMLKPERTYTFEVGTELRFLQDRLTLDVTYYKLNSKDQIIPVLVSPATGFTSYVTNAGEIENKGLEVVLSGTVIKNNDFSWDASVNYTRNRNMVKSIRDDLPEIVVGSLSGYLNSAVTMKYVAGQPVGDLYGLTYRRYYGGKPDDGVTLQKDLPWLIGADGFPIRDLNQRKIGNSMPKWIGGMTHTFRYKDFSLSFLFDAQQGFMKYNQLGNFMSSFAIAKYTENRDSYVVFDGVLADGTPNTKQVWLGQGEKDGVNYGDGYYRLIHRGVSENFVEDASWVRLRSLTLGYNLPASIFNNTFIRDARISLTGNNLWLSTKYTGYDPESSPFNAGSNAALGFAGFTYPAARTVMVSLNVNFK